MRILQVIEATGAGVGRHVRALSAFLAAEGHDVTVAYAPHRCDDAFHQFVSTQRPGIRCVRLELGREVSIGGDLGGVARLCRMMRRNGPFDVVHGHSSKGGAIARVAGRLTGTPAIYTPHSLIMASPELPRAHHRIYTLIERALGQLATSRTIAVSEEERRLMLALKLAPADRVVVVNNGLDDDAFEDFATPRDARDYTDQAPLTFGAIMRFTPQKAPDRLVEAFGRLVATSPRAPLRLLIVGDGELMAQTKEQVLRLGLDDRVALPGWSTDVHDALRGFDIFVMSSLYEGFSYAVLEAMAARLPVVSTQVFGIADTIARVPGNVVVPARSPAALAEGMKTLADLAFEDESRTALARIGDGNHDYAREHFTQRATIGRIAHIYDQARA